MKTFFKYIFYIMAIVTVSYLTYVAVVTGEAQIKTSVFLYSENPIMFVVAIILMLLINGFCIFAFGIEIFTSIDQRVKAFGGNYNINTFKAILRNIVKSR